MAAQKDRLGHAERPGMTLEAADRAAQQSSSYRSLPAVADSTDVCSDPGHLFGREKLNRHSGSSFNTRDDQVADMKPSSGFRAAAWESAEPNNDYSVHGHSSTSVSAVAGLSEYGRHTNPEIRVSRSQHGVASIAEPRSNHGSSYSEGYSTHEQASRDAFPRQGNKSISLSEFSASELSGSQSDKLPAPTAARSSSVLRDSESRQASSSVSMADTVQHGMLPAVHASSKPDYYLHAQQSLSDEAAHMPDSPAEAAADPPAEAAARPVAHPGALHTAEAQPAAASVAGIALEPGSALSQMHQATRKTNCESCCCAHLCPAVTPAGARHV